MVGGAVRIEPDGSAGEHLVAVEQMKLDLAAVGRGQLDGDELGPGARLVRSVDAEPVNLDGIGQAVVARVIVAGRRGGSSTVIVLRTVVELPAASRTV